MFSAQKKIRIILDLAKIKNMLCKKILEIVTPGFSLFFLAFLGCQN